MSSAHGFKVRTALRSGTVTVYGTPNCGWTRKQLDYFETNGVEHSFVDCSDPSSCPSFVDAFPTMIIVGYQEI
jgi:hypothetical protein